MKYPYNLDSTLSVLIQSNIHFIISTDILGNINYFNDKSARQLKLDSLNPENNSKFPNLLCELDRINYRKALLKCLEENTKPQNVHINSIADV